MNSLCLYSGYQRDMMDNHSYEDDQLSFEGLENQTNFLTELSDTKLMPNFLPMMLEEKLKYYQIIFKIIKLQKEMFVRNCEVINKKIDEEFHFIAVYLRARQRSLKKGLLNKAKEKIAMWDRQISACETILNWLRVIDITNNKANIQLIRNFLNTKLTDLEFIESGEVQFHLGEEKLNKSIFTVQRPLGNLGRVMCGSDLKLMVPKLVIGSSGDGDGQFCRPWGACTDSLGHILISDRSNHRVQIFNALGEFVLQFGREGSQPGEFNRPAGITVNKKGQIIVSDKDNHRIQIFTFSGRLITKFGFEGTGPGQFRYPWDVAVNSRFEIAVSDSKNNRVQLFNEFGRFLKIFDWRKMDIYGPRSWLRFLDCPRGLAFTPDDRLLVTDFNNHQVVIIDRNFYRFKIFGSEGGEPGKFFRPQGIACDMYGRFAVADSKNYRVQVFDATNRVIKIFGCQGNAPGQFDCPQGISFHPNGNIVVVDFNNDRIQIF